MTSDTSLYPRTAADGARIRAVTLDETEVLATARRIADGYLTAVLMTDK